MLYSPGTLLYLKRVGHARGVWRTPRGKRGTSGLPHVPTSPGLAPLYRDRRRPAAAPFQLHTRLVPTSATPLPMPTRTPLPLRFPRNRRPRRDALAGAGGAQREARGPHHREPQHAEVRAALLIRVCGVQGLGKPAAEACSRLCLDLTSSAVTVGA
jgi:hypothetical protein